MLIMKKTCLFNMVKGWTACKDLIAHGIITFIELKMYHLFYAFNCSIELILFDIDYILYSSL